MRAELRAIQWRTGVTFIYITHDQSEALTMSDRVAVMSQGRIQQVGTPQQIYDVPENAFVATFVGESNIFAGRISRVEAGEAEIETSVGVIRGRNPAGLSPGDEAMALVRPERMRIIADGQVAGNTVDSAPLRFDFEGAFVSVLLDAGGSRGTMLHLANDGQVRALMQSRPETLRVGFDTEATLILPGGPTAHG